MKVLLGIILLVVTSVGAFVVITDKISAREKEIALQKAQERKAIEAAEQMQIKQQKIELQKQAQRAKLEAQKEAELAKQLAEKKAREEEERIRTHPERLALAEKEVVDANSACTPLIEKVEELTKKVAITEGQYRTLDQTARGLERQEGTSRNSQNRAEGQYNSTYLDSGARDRLSKSERNSASELTRGLTTKASEARAVAERKKVVLELLQDDLTDAQNALAEAQANLQNKIDKLESIKNECLERP